MRIIDAHTHLGQGTNMQLDEKALLGLMDDAGVDFAIICPMDRFLAVDNKEGNELIKRAVKQHPDRFAGMASANPWFGKRAVDEIRRALDEGLMGVKLHPVIQGFHLADPMVYPLIEAAREYNVPVYVHTGTAGIAEPFHAAELAMSFPDVNFIMGHAGASDYYADTVRSSEFADNLWFESSRNGPGNFCYWRTAGVMDRVVFGSNAPEYIPKIEIANMLDVYTDDDTKGIFGENIRKVFRGRLPV